MRRILLTFLLLPLMAVAQPKKQPAAKPIANQEAVAIRALQNILSTGNYNFEVMDLDIPADLKSIMIRFQQGIVSHREWYMKYAQENRNKVPLPYHENFGISKEEYEKYHAESSLMNRVKMVQRQPLVVTNKNGFITMRGNGQFNLFDSLKFNLKNYTLSNSGQRFEYLGEINAEQSSPFGAWRGYRWKIEIGKLEDVLAGKKVDYSLIEINIGTTNAGGTIVLRHKSMLVEAGKPKVNADIFGFLFKKEE